MNIRLTVYFDEPFWVGVFERVFDRCLETCRVVFGAEPKDYEIYDFLLKNIDHLKFSRPIAADTEEEKKINPKRLQREVKREVNSRGIGTKAQLAMKLEQEARKVEHRVISKAKREELEELKFQKRQEKKKEKKKGH
ncbi:MAG: YjdF family protein [Clostridia bacterium]|nr:YjdF family protein [Clostridia bacterium]